MARRSTPATPRSFAGKAMPLLPRRGRLILARIGKSAPFALEITLEISNEQVVGDMD
jgi:hypothetical protein